MSQLDGIEKFKWLKIWNSNNETKHVARFPMDIVGIGQLEIWMIQITFW
jgi:hypothetical protein